MKLKIARKEFEFILTQDPIDLIDLQNVITLEDVPILKTLHGKLQDNHRRDIAADIVAGEKREDIQVFQDSDDITIEIKNQLRKRLVQLQLESIQIEYPLIYFQVELLHFENVCLQLNNVYMDTKFHDYVIECCINCELNTWIFETVPFLDINACKSNCILDQYEKIKGCILDQKNNPTLKKKHIVLDLLRDWSHHVLEYDEENFDYISFFIHLQVQNDTLGCGVINISLSQQIHVYITNPLYFQQENSFYPCFCNLILDYDQNIKECILGKLIDFHSNLIAKA